MSDAPQLKISAEAVRAAWNAPRPDGDQEKLADFALVVGRIRDKVQALYDQLGERENQEIEEKHKDFLTIISEFLEAIRSSFRDIEQGIRPYGKYGKMYPDIMTLLRNREKEPPANVKYPFRYIDKVIKLPDLGVIPYAIASRNYFSEAKYALTIYRYMTAQQLVQSLRNSLDLLAEFLESHK